MNHLVFKVTGTKYDLDELKKALLTHSESSGLEFSQPTSRSLHRTGSAPTQQVELLDMTIHFGIAVLAHAAVDWSKRYDWVRQFLATHERKGGISVTEQQPSAQERSDKPE